MRTFTMLWCGQLISGLGSSLTGFALGIWVYQQTGSAMQFAMTTFSYVLPFAVVASVAGTLVDRWDRRHTLIGADSGQALVTLTLAMLLFSQQLSIWHIYLAAVVSSILSAFQGPAFGASVVLLVPKQHLSRAAGMGQVSNAVHRLLAPLLAGVLVASMGLGGVLLVDLVTFGVAILTYLLVRIPTPPRTSTPTTLQGSLWRETLFGWQYLLARPGLLGLILIGGLRNFFVGVANVLTVPLVLSFAHVTAVSLVLAVGSAGLLIGGSIMSAWAGPRQRVQSSMAFLALEGLGTIIAGWRPAISFVAAGRALANMGLAGGAAVGTAIEQSKIAPDVQGRVFGAVGMVSLLLEASAYPTAGLLADQVFEPWLAGRLGPGRGIALLNIVMGLCLIATAIVGSLHPRIRCLEAEVPDVQVELASR